VFKIAFALVVCSLALLPTMALAAPMDVVRGDPGKACVSMLDRYAMDEISPYNKDQGFTEKNYIEMTTLCGDRAPRGLCMGSKDMIEMKHPNFAMTCQGPEN
jgi:hypothetical protein